MERSSGMVLMIPKPPLSEPEVEGLERASLRPASLKGMRHFENWARESALRPS